MKLTLPSQILYDCPFIELKELTIKDLKELSVAYNNKDYQKIFEIYSNRISGNLNFYSLTVQDFEYIVINDKFSFPESNMSTDVTCPFCKEENTFHILASDLKVKNLDPKLKSLELKLKLQSNEVIYLKIPQIYDIIFTLSIDQKTNISTLFSFENLIDYLPFLIRKEQENYLIENFEIDNLNETEKIKSEYKRRYNELIENSFLSIYDIKLISYVFKNYFDFGVYTKIKKTCFSCGREFEFILDINSLSETPFCDNGANFDNRILFDTEPQDTTFGDTGPNNASSNILYEQNEREFEQLESELKNTNFNNNIKTNGKKIRIN